MAAPTVLIMGPPGAGKGTQSSHLTGRYALRHVATGDLLREAVAQGTSLGLEAKRFMDDGNLVPDDVIVGMIRELVGELDDETGILLDGFPTKSGAASTSRSTSKCRMPCSWSACPVGGSAGPAVRPTTLTRGRRRWRACATSTVASCTSAMTTRPRP